MNSPARIPRRHPSRAEQGNAGYTIRARQNGRVRTALREQADRDLERDEAERAIDHAVARNVAWARQQYILNLPADMNTKINLIHGDAP